ncbi:SPOR domain-containing protein [Rhizobium sp. YS-1r]|uniref:SPOR domain-containing protein n=1 Tax=Rhizobium sp. YS-1r TaxID=1532558 RepID=UPI00055ECC82|nr:SPOR domain-containing protein [Rhizobium sp. YS-1r]
MADNNLVRSRNDFPDFFADDDPLAELARIVGYEDRPVPKPEAPVAVAPAPQDETTLNLEDELLREFERYDAPRLDPVQDITLDDAPYASVEPAPAVSISGPPVELEEPDFVPAEPSVAELSPDFPPSRDDMRDRDDFGFGDEEPPLAVETVDASQSVGKPDLDANSVEPIPDVSDETVAVSASFAEPAEQPIEEFDLAAELESSIGEPVVETEPEVKPEPKAKGYTPGFRMPLVNFNVARATAPAPRQEPAAPVPDGHVSDAQAPEDFPAAAREQAPVAQVAAGSPVPDPTAETEEVPATSVPSAPPAPVATAESASAPDRFSELDELIYDVQRYELPSEARPLAPPVANTDSEASVVASPVVEPAAPAAEVLAAKTPLVEEKDPFSDEEFELALDDLELDLADLVVAETNRQPEATAAPTAKAVDAAPAKLEAPAEQIAPVAATAAATASAEAVEEVELFADLPFDPAQIADSEDQVEAIAELDVPSLPAEEPEQPPVYRPDYDLDIDAELATLLMTPDKADAAQHRKPEIDIAASVQAGGERRAQADRPSSGDLDDFERALEEDFRRSLATPLPPAEHEELQYAETDYLATVENARRSVMQKWAVPLVVAGVVVLGGVGAYAWLGSGISDAVSGGEPVVIAADTDPVKVAPENPGGKTVPNQDKAVYDRVAGVASQEPKQETLISSNEEPVDVVQKTLMPDTLPLEGENEIEATEIGETEDPRLLPQQPEQAAAPAEQQPVTVMPRKVKTMIVRPDGKLVEQEVAAPALAAPEKMPAAGTKPVDVAAASQPAAASIPAAPAQVPAASSAGAAGIVPVSTQARAAEPVEVAKVDPVAPAGTPAPVEAAPVEPAAAPEVPVEASDPAPVIRAPVPIARPAEQPVNVVAAVTDQGNVRASNQQAAAPASTSAQGASVGAGGYLIQIASLPSEAEAQKSYQNLSARYAGVIGGRGVDIKAAEIAGKGTFYRVRIPAGSKSDAVALCEKYRAAGGNCLVAR